MKTGAKNALDFFAHAHIFKNCDFFILNFIQIQYINKWTLMSDEKYELLWKFNADGDVLKIQCIQCYKLWFFQIIYRINFLYQFNSGMELFQNFSRMICSFIVKYRKYLNILVVYFQKDIKHLCYTILIRLRPFEKWNEFNFIWVENITFQYFALFHDLQILYLNWTIKEGNSW